MPGVGNSVKALRILGTRGVPATHGGFETFAERLALHLVGRAWRVTVYVQQEGGGPVVEDDWQGVARVRIPVKQGGALGTVVFDWRATRHAARSGELCLVLGYNTAVFSALLRRAGVPHLMNMDGLEWQRAKWGPLARAWLRVNEYLGGRLAEHLVADHPEIARHLARFVDARKISTIVYGADRVGGIDDAAVRAMGLQSGGYLTLIARPEPENSVLEVVEGFSRSHRGQLLAVLGDYRTDNAYHQAVLRAAGAEVRFVGALYDKAVVQALRCHCTAYVHGHRVGGTNPSLVEALGAGNAVLAHDNRFNRWVAGDAARYFRSADDVARVLDALLPDEAALAALRRASRARFEDAFTWPAVLDAYETMLTRWLPSR